VSDLFERLRKTEFKRLDEAGHVYLDYTGSGLYGESQVRAHADLLAGEVFGNPHSGNPTSLLATQYVETARARVLDFFDADPDEYDVIFTLNASGALKLVGESYPFTPESRCVLIADNHNSVNGIREFAKAHRAQVRYLPLDDELRVADIERGLAGLDGAKDNLFCYPAQSNFSGVKHPLEWVEHAKALGYDVLLDAAAYVPTNPLSLREVRPDFVCLSFYKMFGYPTGVGALLARRELLPKLQRPWFGGGTVRFVSAQNQVHRLHTTGEAFEDGTLNFLDIAAVPAGLDFLDGIGMENIQRHVARLTERLLSGLLGLHHSSGKPVVDLYGPATMHWRGGTVSFNVMMPDGAGDVASGLVEEMANERNISLRTGCFCNPGAAESAFNYSAIEAYQCFDAITAQEFTLQQFSVCMNELPVGAVRVSLGIASNQADVDAFLDFMRAFIDFEPDPAYRWRVPERVEGGA
jgi:molybdenum cofactor sulfurtransferase